MKFKSALLVKIRLTILYDALLNNFIQADIREYDEFITLLKNWRNEIINSFIRINGRRINNGVAESINQNIAALKDARSFI